MSISLTVTGLDEMISSVKSSRAGIPTAIYVAMAAAMADVRKDVATYPPQRPPSNPQSVYIRGVGTRYTRKDGTSKTYKTSERYGATTIYRVVREADNIVGFVNSKASYAIYLRGTLLDPTFQAWMHQNRWKTLADISEAAMPMIAARVTVAINDYLNRNKL